MRGYGDAKARLEAARRAAHELSQVKAAIGRREAVGASTGRLRQEADGLAATVADACGLIDAARPFLGNELCAVLDAYYIGGLTFPQTASELGVTASTCRSRRDRALERLRQAGEG